MLLSLWCDASGSLPDHRRAQARTMFKGMGGPQVPLVATSRTRSMRHCIRFEHELDEEAIIASERRGELEPPTPYNLQTTDIAAHSDDA